MKKATALLVAAAVTACASMAEAATGSSGWFFVDTVDDEFRIEDVYSDYCDGKYGGIGGHKATFLSGVTCWVRFDVTGGSEASPIARLLVNGRDADTPRGFILNVGSLPVGDSLIVEAFTEDGRRSKPFRVNLEMASLPPTWNLTDIRIGELLPAHGVHKRPGLGKVVYMPLQMDLLPFGNFTAGDDDAYKISIGDASANLSFTPKLELTDYVESDTGEHRTTGDLGGSLSRDRFINQDALIGTRLSVRKQPLGRLFGANIDATLKGSIVRKWNDKAMRWVNGPGEVGVGISGSAGLMARIPETLNIVYVKVDALFQGDFSARKVDGEWSFNARLDPLVALRGTLGAGVEGIACLEGYAQGGLFIDLNVPPVIPDVKEFGFNLKAGWRFVFLGFERNGEANWYHYWVGGPREAMAAVPRLMAAAPMEGSVSGYRLISRDYGGGRAGARPSLRLTAAGDAGGVSLGDGYPNPAPSIAANGKADHLVYLRDNSGRSDINRTEMVYRSGVSNEWNGASAVWDDGTADFMPKVAVASDGTVFAAWANARRALSDTDSLETLCTNLEIAVGVRNAGTGAWSCRNLTNDSALDMNPVLKVATDGSAAVAWVRNAACEFVGSAARPSSVMLAYCRNGSWTTPQTVANVGAVSSLDLAYDGTAAEVVWTKDGDGDMSTSGDREVWGTTVASGVVGAAARISSEGVDAARPHVWFGTNGVQKVWLENNVLTADGGEAVSGADALNLSEEFAVLPHSNGVATLAWWRSGKDGIGGELVSASYDAANGSVGAATALGGSGATQERAITGAVGSDGALRVAYESVAVSTNVEGTVQFGAVELKTLRREAGIDLDVSGVAFTNEAVVGESAQVQVTVSNAGGTEAKEVEVWLWLGEGDSKSMVSVASANVKPFSSEVVSIPWYVSKGLTNVVFTVEVDPRAQIADADRENNTFVWRPDLGEPRLSFGTARCVNASETGRMITATVCNSSLAPLAAGAVVKFWRGEVGGELLGTDTIGAVTAGDGGEYTAGIELDVSGIANFAEHEDVVVELMAGSPHPTVSVSVARELAAEFETYKVTYLPGGGDVGGSSQTDVKTNDVPLTLRGALFTLEGHRQSGWNTVPNQGSREYELGGQYTDNADVTLYPTWAANTYTVRFDANGGTGTMADMAIQYAVPTNLQANAFTKDGCTFAGWATNGTGKVVYVDGEAVSNLTTVAGGVVDLFAVWTLRRIDLPVEIDGVATNLTLILGEAFGELPEPGARQGYTFGGWYTQPEGQGMRITPTTIVPEGLTGIYAYWMKDAVPEPQPQPQVWHPSQPWTAKKAVTLDGAVYDADGKVAGVVQLKVAKLNAKKHNAKVSGAVTLLDGKKRTLKAATVNVPSDAPISANLAVKGLGTLSLTIGDDGFEGSVGGYFLAAAKVGGAWTRKDSRVYAVATSATLPEGTVKELLPGEDGEPVRVKGGKWAFDKAASITYKKGVLGGDNDPKKPNRSAMKLTYTPKTGLFKGSFKLYAIQGGKIKKYTVKVTGVVVDGEGTGVGKLAKPATAWSVSVK